MSRRGGKTCSFDLFENFKTPKFADTQFWLDTDAKDQICLSSLSNVFLNACLTGGSNYQGSLWVESNTDDRALLLLDLMSGCPHRSHWQTGVKGAPPPHWKDRRKHTLPTLGKLSEYKPEVGTGERLQWFSSFVPSRCQKNCVTWKSFLFSLHLFSIKHSHSHWLVWNWDGVLSQLCVGPHRSASYSKSRVWNRCGLSTTVFIGQSLHWCISPRVRLLRIGGSRESQRQGDSQEERERKRGVK